MDAGDLIFKRASATCLDQNAIQSGSDKTGQETGTAGIAAGQAPSQTDAANFINFCAGKTLTNGNQATQGSCNGIPMGEIPATTNMVSAIILSPQTGQQMPEKTTFNVTLQVNNLQAGVFTNPNTTYYSAPQRLNSNGNIIGHAHVTIQDIGSFNPTTPPDANTFAFFKGIDDAGNGQGRLQAEVTGGLAAGIYRVCTLMGAANHQPVIMPVAKRGAQDDCTKFQVVAGNSGSSSSSGNSANSGSSTSSGSSASSSSSTSSGKTASSGSSTSSGSTASSGNVAIKSGSLGGNPPAVTKSNDSTRPFSVNGNTFVNEAAAVQRACDIQFNACADAVNGGKLQGKTLSDCQAQQSSCGAA